MSFFSSGAGKVYNVLLERVGRVASTKDVKAACSSLGVNYSAAIAGLIRANALEPAVFKGVYYVRSLEEHALGKISSDPIEVVARACNLKLGSDWYFGLASALKIAGLWKQQTLTAITVVSRKRVFAQKASFAGTTVEFKQLSGVPFDELVRKRGAVRYSDPARTVLDCAYFTARGSESKQYCETVFADVAPNAGGKKKLAKKAISLASKYPGLYARFLKNFLEKGGKSSKV